MQPTIAQAEDDIIDLKNSLDALLNDIKLESERLAALPSEQRCSINPQKRSLAEVNPIEEDEETPISSKKRKENEQGFFVSNLVHVYH